MSNCYQIDDMLLKCNIIKCIGLEFVSYYLLLGIMDMIFYFELFYLPSVFLVLC